MNDNNSVPHASASPANRRRTPRTRAAALALVAGASAGAWSTAHADAQLPANTGKGPAQGEYHLLRFNDQPPSAPATADWSDSLKHISFGNPDDQIYLSLDGLERFQFNSYSHESLGSTSYDGQRFYQYRHIYGADLHLGPQLRMFGELGSAQVADHQAAKQPARQVNDAFVEQAFVEANTAVGNGSLTVRVGRQQMWLGNGLLVTTQPNANVPWSFDGIDMSWRSDSVLVDTFRVEAVQTGTGGFDDDRRTDARRMWGVYSSFALPQGGSGASKLNLDAFYIGTRWEGMKFAGTAGTDRRGSYGARLWGKLGGLAVDWTAIAQVGRYAGTDVSAYGVYSTTGHTFGSVPLKPTVAVHADLISGGYSESKTHTYNPLYSGQVYYAASGYLAGSNMIDAGPALSLQVAQNVRVTVYNRWYWKQNEKDFIYGRGFVALPGTNDSSASYMGMQPDINCVWQVSRHLFLSPELAYFKVGKTLESAGGDDVFYSQLDLSFIF
ncbi:alginate export family protein [Solimonas marina]|uniref:Alginate export family protein n=1 Tax=Solimonas marina TaxID=2714601 RepID=A0A970B7T9_9GAMM|nr:alginate export family protein [Solimonas marina]NKF20751.1 alginate export family protein [Solimonas marina]